MKQKTITTDKATLLVVECPIGYSLFHDDDDDDDWELIGRLPDITEIQASEVVDSYEVSHNLDLTVTLSFKDYVNGIECDDPVNCDCDYWDEYSFDTAIESLFTLLQANEVYFENPIKFSHNKEGVSNGSLLDWHEAQSKVWDKERTYLFKKI